MQTKPPLSLSLTALVLAGGLTLPAPAANDIWDNNPGGNWETGGNWTDNTTPGNTDTATFNLALAYPVTFGVAPAAIQNLTVSAGTVTFGSTGGAKTLNVNTAGGGNDLIMAGAGTSLILGTTPSNAVNLTVADDLSIAGGATLEARFGSDIVANDFSSVGLNGTLRLDGAGSSLTLNSTGSLPIATTTTASLNFINGSTGNTINAGLAIASGGTIGVNGTLAINGGSSLTQNGATAITVGHATTGAGTVNIGTTATGGTLTTGTGVLTINPTGTVAIGSGANDGTLNANGNVTLNGGQLTRATTSVFNLAAGRTMSIQNGGDVTIAGGYAHSTASTVTVTGAGSTLDASSLLSFTGGSTLNVLAGGEVSSITGVSVGSPAGSGTILADGMSSLLSGGSLTLGSAGSTGTATFSNGGAGSFNSILVAVSATAGMSGTLNIQSGAAVTGSQLTVANNVAAGTGTVTVTGTGSTLTLNGGSPFTVGANSQSTGTVNVQTGGTLTSGTGTMTVNPTGTIAVSAGTFNANGNLTLNGGQFTGNGPNALVFSPGRQMTVQGGGDAVFAGDFNQLTRANLTIAGTGSTFSTGGSFRWDGEDGSNTLTVLSVNNGGRISSGNALHLAQNNAPVSLGVSGTGSQISAAAFSTSEWNAVVSLSSGASATLGGLRLADVNFASPSFGLLEVQSGATASLGNIAAVSTIDSNTAEITVNGAGSTVTQTGASTLTLGNAFLGSAALFAQNGGIFTSGTGAITLNATGTINIEGGAVNLNGPLTDNGGTVNFTSGALSMASNFKVGTGGLLGDGDLTFAANRGFSTTAGTTIDAFHVLTLDGGTFRTGTLTNNGGLAFNSGTLGITGAGGFNIGTGALGGSVTLRDGALLDVTNTTLVSAGATLRFDGGSIRTALINILGTVRVDRGTAAPDVVFVNGGGRLFVADTLAFAANGSHSILTGGRLTLEDGALVTGQGTLGSDGLVTGDGTVAIFFGSSGEVRAEAGKTLYFTSGTSAHSGRCNLQGGTLAYSQPFTNDAAGQINGHGELYFPVSPVPSAANSAAGLNNSGQMNLSGGDSLIFGTVAMNAGSRLIASGGATATFFDVFRHAGAEVKASTGSALVFFGEVRGPGNFTGTGAVYMEGGYSPGASPASVSLTPQLVFTESNVLTMELGGLTAGTEYDKLLFNSAATPQVTWGGSLAVTFINGFPPAAGQSFDIFDFDAARDAGTFDSISLPSLPAGLTWNTSQLYTAGIINIVPEGLSFAAWAAASGIPGALPTGDHDSDGYDNAAEFALGLFPPQPGTVAPNGGLHTYVDGERLRVLFTRPLDRTGLTLIVQASDDLTTWADLATSVDSQPFAGPGFVSENRAHPLDQPGLVEVRDICTTSFSPRRLLRVRITLAP